MKKTILSVAIVLAAIAANAQKVKEAEVPTEVKAAFTKQYPGAKAKGWEKEKGNYEVEFDSNKNEMTLVIDPKGTVLETETEIKVSDLSKAITDYCAQKYAGQKIKEASKIVDAKGIITFEAEINKMDVLFDAKGNFIKESK